MLRLDTFAQAMKLNEFRFPTTDGKVDMPLFAVKYSKPTEGWPPKVNMDKFAESIFHGFEKDREPLEIQLTPGLQPGEPLYQGSVALTKGFCRCSIILYGIVQTIMKEDHATMSEAERAFFTECTGCKMGFNSEHDCIIIALDHHPYES